MGKKGDALRAAKMQRTVYTFTREQLEARDRTLLQDYRERCHDKLRKHLNETREDWMAQDLKYLLALSCMALHKEFGWTGIPKNRKPHPRCRMQRFAEALAEEACTVMEIQEYCNMVYDQLGVGFAYGEEEQR